MLNFALSSLDIVTDRGVLLYQAIEDNDEQEVNKILASQLRPYWEQVKNAGKHMDPLLKACCTSSNIVSALLRAYTILDLKDSIESILRQSQVYPNISKIFEFIKEDSDPYCRTRGEALLTLTNAGFYERIHRVILASDSNKNSPMQHYIKKSMAIATSRHDMWSLSSILTCVADRMDIDELIAVKRTLNPSAGLNVKLQAIIDFRAIKNELNLDRYDYNKFYKAIVEKDIQALRLVHAIIHLHNSGITYKDYRHYYKKLITISSYEAESLAKTLVSIHSSGNAEIYRLLAQNPKNLVTIALCVEKLISNNVLYYDNVEIYNLLAQCTTSSVEDFIQSILALKDENISYQNNSALYQHLANNASGFGLNLDLAHQFIKLKSSGFSYQDYPQFYELIVEFVPQKITSGIIALANLGIPYQECFELYSTIIKDCLTENYGCWNDSYWERSYKPFALLKMLHHLDIHYSDNPTYFCESLLITHVDLAKHAFEKLHGIGYFHKNYKIIYQLILDQLSKENANYQGVLNAVNKLCALGSQAFELELEHLTEMVEASISPSTALTYGPLVKTEATLKIENILEQIAELDPDCHELISFNENNEYILTLPEQVSINLSLLIKNANLSQLTLSNTVIARLGDILKKLTNYNYFQSFSYIVSLLPPTLQDVINIYISQHYININGLFRSEPLSPQHSLNPDNHKNMLAYFLLGSLLNEATNRMAAVADQSVEKILLERIANHYHVKIHDLINSPTEFQALLQKSLHEKVINNDEYSQANCFDKLKSLYPEIVLLDRGERLDDEIINRRTANPWTFPAITSFSVIKDGSLYFRKAGTTRTKLQSSQFYYVMNSEEGEVLFAHGEQVITTQGPGFLQSSIIRSPLYAQNNHYWSDTALAQANKIYSTEYAEETSAIVLDDKIITRPNHNMSHAYRVMLASELVANYFADYAIDPEFRKFCDNLTDIDFEWLRVAAAFSITGRESEIAATQELARYDRYRAASADHFLAFVEQSALNVHDIMKLRMYNVVRYMGNPYYETTLNDFPIAHERKQRNFYHRLLSIAHKLDLPRCYSVAEFNRAMQLCKDLSVQNNKQANAFSEMVRYNIALIKAHGGRLSCDILPSGELVDVHTHYKDIYAQSSTSMKRLFELTQLVPKPIRVPQVVSIEENVEASCSSGCSLEDDAQPTAKRTHRSSEINVYRTKRQRI